VTSLSTPDEPRESLTESLRKAMRQAMYPEPLFDRQEVALSVDPDVYRCRVETIRQARSLANKGWITMPKGFAIDRPMFRPSVYDVASGFVLNPEDARVLASTMPDHVAWARFIPLTGALPPELTNRFQRG
jgi:hypothetical protein